MTTFEDAPESLIPYRVRVLEGWKKDTEAWKGTVDDDRRDLRYLREDVGELTSAVNDMKKILVRASVTVASSAIMILVSVLISTGHTP